jgi:hypothetical protein
MKNLLLAAAAATLVIGAAPAFAGYSDDVHNNADVRCHYVTKQVRMPDGHVVYHTDEVCTPLYH